MAVINPPEKKLVKRTSVHWGNPGGGQVSRDGNFAFRIHPAGQSVISKQQWSVPVIGRVKLIQ